MNSGQWKWTDSTDFIYTNWRDGNIPSSGLKFEKIRLIQFILFLNFGIILTI